MGFVKELDKLSDRGLIKLINFLLLIAPGAAVLYRYNRSLIIELDIFKLILLSAAFTLPVFLLAFLTLRIVELIAFFRDRHWKWRIQSEPNARDEGIDTTLFNALFLANGLLFAWLTVAYIIGASAKAFAIEVAATTLLFSLLSIIIALAIWGYSWFARWIVQRQARANHVPPIETDEVLNRTLYVPDDLDEAADFGTPLYTQDMATSSSTPKVKAPSKKQFLKVLKKVAKKA